MNKPKVSLIICTHNRKNLVPRAIDSALAQVGVTLEVIVVDDCSTDGTYEYLSEIYSDRVTLVKTEVNSGVSTATNLGYRHCEGEYIALLGDDDYWEDPNKTAMQLELMTKNQRLGVTGTWWVELQESGTRAEKKPILPKRSYFIKEKMLMGGGIVCGSTPIVSREAWEAVGGMDERQLRGTDSDLFRKIIFAGYGVKVVPKITTVVDVGHKGPRMTSIINSDFITKHLYSNLNVLHKFWKEYLLFPRALIVRLRSIGGWIARYFKNRLKE